MGVETITKAMVRYEAAMSGGSEADLAASLGIDTNGPKWSHELEVAVRRDVIFGGDNATYQTIRKYSDGFEHGFADWEQLWSFPEDLFAKSAGYLRTAILKAYRLSAATFDKLVGAPFDTIVQRGSTLAFEATAPITAIDLRARDFKIARVRREQLSSSFDPSRGEYSFEYQLSAGGTA